MIAAEFYDLCANHDWHYAMSDDGRVWRRGEAQRGRLIRLAMENADFNAIYIAWTEHIYSGTAFGTPKQPRPERPKVVTFEGEQPSVHPDQLSL